MALPPPGIYAITPDADNDDELLAKVSAALDAGIRLLQYRNSSADAATRLRQAGKVAQRCRAASACFIVNNDIDIAFACRADGVHLGASDAPAAQARAQLGNDALIGITCRDSLARAQDAAQSGADYIALGALYPSATKPDAPRCALSQLGLVKRQVGLPLVGIGGITRANAPDVLAAGADYLGVIKGLFDGDIADNARHLQEFFIAV